MQFGRLVAGMDCQEMEHVCSVLYHPRTQGKIERWHQTLKNSTLLEYYYLPGDLERQVAAFVVHYNHARYHEPRQSYPSRRLLRAH